MRPCLQFRDERSEAPPGLPLLQASNARPSGGHELSHSHGNINNTLTLLDNVNTSHPNFSLQGFELCHLPDRVHSGERRHRHPAPLAPRADLPRRRGGLSPEQAAGHLPAGGHCRLLGAHPARGHAQSEQHHQERDSHTHAACVPQVSDPSSGL